MLTVRAMEMHRVCAIGVIDEAHDRLSALAHLESRAWCDAIIANELCLAKVGIHFLICQHANTKRMYPKPCTLLLKGLDIDLVVVNRRSIGEGELTCVRLAW